MHPPDDGLFTSIRTLGPSQKRLQPDQQAARNHLTEQTRAPQSNYRDYVPSLATRAWENSLLAFCPVWQPSSPLASTSRITLHPLSSSSPAAKAMTSAVASPRSGATEPVSIPRKTHNPSSSGSKLGAGVHPLAQLYRKSSPDQRRDFLHAAKLPNPLETLYKVSSPEQRREFLALTAAASPSSPASRKLCGDPTAAVARDGPSTSTSGSSSMKRKLSQLGQESVSADVSSRPASLAALPPPLPTPSDVVPPSLSVTSPGMTVTPSLVGGTLGADREPEPNGLGVLIDASDSPPSLASGPDGNFVTWNAPASLPSPPTSVSRLDSSDSQPSPPSPALQLPPTPISPNPPSESRSPAHPPLDGQLGFILPEMALESTPIPAEGIPPIFADDRETSTLSMNVDPLPATRSNQDPSTVPSLIDRTPTPPSSGSTTLPPALRARLLRASRPVKPFGSLPSPTTTTTSTSSSTTAMRKSRRSGSSANHAVTTLPPHRPSASA